MLTCVNNYHESLCLPSVATHVKLQFKLMSE